MKNTLTDLNDHLFAQMERLGDEDLSEEELQKEVRRSDAMSKVAANIIKNGELALKTMQHMDEYGYNQEKNVPEMLVGKKQRAISTRG